jgi:hypothetical protein
MAGIISECTWEENSLLLILGRLAPTDSLLQTLTIPALSIGTSVTDKQFEPYQQLAPSVPLC